ncbi:MAG TPA: efflux transporter outer membrane subunit [Casimicrobiaceae bacterium]
MSPKGRPEGEARLMKRVCTFAALALAGCMVGPDYHRPDVALPQQFPEGNAVDTQPEAAVPATWWMLYGDPVLNDLVDAALAHNADIAVAVARIEQAQAVLRQANAGIIPGLDLSANGGRQAFSNSVPTPRVVTGMGFTLSTNYEIDFWGRIRRTIESAQASLLSSRYAHDVTELSLSATTAETYFTLRALDALIAVTRDSLQSFDASVNLTRRRAEGGVASDLDVRQAENQRQVARVQLAELIRQRAIALHQLQVLTARLDLDLAPGDVRSLPVPALPPAGVPSALLGRRPDVRQAEAALAAQNARIGVARAAMFPTISLTGDYGNQSTALTTLLSSPGRVWSIGLALAFPLFDAGRREAVTEQEEARTREAIAAYQSTVQSAFRDVQDALTNIRQNRDAEEDVRLRVESADAALRLAQRRYESGYSAFLEVLVAQRTLYDAQTGAVQNRQALMLATVDLMKALGGGWQPPEAPSPAAAGTAPRAL